MQPEDEINDINFYLGIQPSDSDLTIDITLISKASLLIDYLQERGYNLHSINLLSECGDEGLELIFLVGDKKISIEFPIEDSEYNIITIQEAIDKLSWYRPKIMVYDLGLENNIEILIDRIKQETEWIPEYAGTI